jgi:hypothetical protein
MRAGPERPSKRHGYRITPYVKITGHGNRATGNLAPLSAPERSRLDQLEATIRRGREVLRKVALALLEIRDRRLYRATHATFRAYCKGTLGYGTS